MKEYGLSGKKYPRFFNGIPDKEYYIKSCTKRSDIMVYTANDAVFMGVE